MSDKHDREILIPVLTFGEMRRVNIAIPEQFANEPDERSLALPLPAARAHVREALESWGIGEFAVRAYVESATSGDLSNLLVIQQLLFVIFKDEPQANYVQAQNKHFGSRTIWQVIHGGDSLDVRRYLEHFVFSDGW